MVVNEEEGEDRERDRDGKGWIGVGCFRFTEREDNVIIRGQEQRTIIIENV